MAEQVMIVCDVCGAPATASVNMQVHGGGTRDGQKFAKDLCNTHLSEMIANARKPRRGRRRASVATPTPASTPATRSRKPRTPSAARKASTAGRRRGRPRKSAAATPAEGAAR